MTTVVRITLELDQQDLRESGRLIRKHHFDATFICIWVACFDTKQQVRSWTARSIESDQTSAEDTLQFFQPIDEQ